jgi:serine protease Do
MKKFLALLTLVFIFLAALIQWKAHRIQGERAPEKFTPAVATTLDLKDVQILSAMDRESTRLVEAVVPSVVSITTARKLRVQDNPLLVDPLEQFFGMRRRRAPRELVQNALGSGVIVSKEGHILTNNHVIANVDEVKVQLKDGRVLPATIVGSDEESDIAVLKIDAQNITPLPLGDSDQVKVGQLVFAVGNPFGLQESVTRGTISAKRGRMGEDSGEDFFQTDTAINPGNSGGPLINVRGEIIGINNAIGGQTGNWAGIGFAIPSNVARRTMEALLKNGHVAHGYLGVRIQELTPELAEQFGVPNQTGAVVSEVTANSPAEKAGLRNGDIIVKFNGRSLKGMQDFRNRVADSPVDSKIELVVIRGGKETPVSVAVAERPADFSANQAPAPAPAPAAPAPATPQPAPTIPDAENVLAGIRVGEIPADHRADLPENAKGVMVTQIEPDAPAARLLQPGDVIEEIGHQPVISVSDFEKAAQSLKPGEKQMLFICRGKTRSFVVLTPR